MLVVRCDNFPKIGERKNRYELDGDSVRRPRCVVRPFENP